MYSAGRGRSDSLVRQSLEELHVFIGVRGPQSVKELECEFWSMTCRQVELDSPKACWVAVPI